jgi:cytoskeletal protein RodZ
MTGIQQKSQRRQRRLFAAIAGWALLGAASTGIVACTNAAAQEATSSAQSAATSNSAPSSTAPTSTSSSSASASTSSAAPTSSEAAASSSTAEPTTAAAAASTYADGTYTATGSYSSPGGTETISISLTLSDDVITAATAEGEATGGPSSQYQGEFEENFAALIVGKDIDDVSLDKVAGSSLTSGGFNAAVETIKSDALA